VEEMMMTRERKAWETDPGAKSRKEAGGDSAGKKTEGA
jgi:hypothetical protein